MTAIWREWRRERARRKVLRLGEWMLHRWDAEDLREGRAEIQTVTLPPAEQALYDAGLPYETVEAVKSEIREGRLVAAINEAREGWWKIQHPEVQPGRRHDAGSPRAPLDSLGHLYGAKNAVVALKNEMSL